MGKKHRPPGEQSSRSGGSDSDSTVTVIAVGAVVPATPAALAEIENHNRGTCATSSSGEDGDDKASLPRLKDQTCLMNHLGHPWQPVKDKVNSGVGQDGSLLLSSFLKGFLAGYVVAKLRTLAVLGFAVGTCTGIYAAQANMEKTLKSYFRSLQKGPD
ncbi:SLC35A4 upstream open reading frame protein-like [Acomys russatus]|uniref:SLC35A4 upstream open reading frame protein-like n=1 Tax=Acomys russatus TaxID=60746 RepID=UPI0021E26DD6|nr:SLC35A4 upstream open reading frame protein-like [Acomys russatus]